MSLRCPEKIKRNRDVRFDKESQLKIHLQYNRNVLLTMRRLVSFRLCFQSCKNTSGFNTKRNQGVSFCFGMEKIFELRRRGYRHVIQSPSLCYGIPIPWAIKYSSWRNIIMPVFVCYRNSSRCSNCHIYNTSTTKHFF